MDFLNPMYGTLLLNSEAKWINLSPGSALNNWGCVWNACFLDAEEDGGNDDGFLLREISTSPDSLLSVVSSFVTCIFSFPASPETWNPLNLTSDFLVPETSCLLRWKTGKCNASFFETRCEISKVFNFLCILIGCCIFEEILVFLFLLALLAFLFFIFKMVDFRKQRVCHPGCVTCTIGLSDLRTGYSAVPGLTTTWTESAWAVTFAKSFVAEIFKSPDLSSTWKCAFCPVLSAADIAEMVSERKIAHTVNIVPQKRSQNSWFVISFVGQVNSKSKCGRLQVPLSVLEFHSIVFLNINKLFMLIVLCSKKRKNPRVVKMSKGNFTKKKIKTTVLI